MTGSSVSSVASLSRHTKPRGFTANQPPGQSALPTGFSSRSTTAPSRRYPIFLPRGPGSSLMTLNRPLTAKRGPVLGAARMSTPAGAEPDARAFAGAAASSAVASVDFLGQPDSTTAAVATRISCFPCSRRMSTVCQRKGGNATFSLHARTEHQSARAVVIARVAIGHRVLRIDHHVHVVVARNVARAGHHHAFPGGEQLGSDCAADG